MWREPYECETFEAEVEELWKTLKPFYQQLHACVGRRLIRRYPHSGIKADRSIYSFTPAWSMWALTYDIVMPYPNKDSIDITETMELQLWRCSKDLRILPP
ncbi:angiotensin-converting enzyme [Trichonephila clavipes]|nr:angiotensin-converting enzyme [Trichonephila clavipes]